MVTHIVLWNLHEQAEGHTRAENAQIAKEKLEALQGTIPTLKTIKVGIDRTDKAQSADVVLFTQFASWEDLDAYQNHPNHQAILPFMRAIVSERKAADFED